MLADFATGAAILFAFVAVYIAGDWYLGKNLERWVSGDEDLKTKRYRVAIGIWMLVVTLSFVMFAYSGWGVLVAKMAPFIILAGVTSGIYVILVTLWRDG